jgi:hypothetical protein
MHDRKKESHCLHAHVNNIKHGMLVLHFRNYQSTARLFPVPAMSTTIGLSRWQNEIQSQELQSTEVQTRASTE